MEGENIDWMLLTTLTFFMLRDCHLLLTVAWHLKDENCPKFFFKLNYFFGYWVLLAIIFFPMNAYEYLCFQGRLVHYTG